ncbi:hypothetical protein GCM10022252_32220 [Streptosporangium oxazolinicum]|uniref:DUF1622 domain-containing protein n=1 Tax=Streptosporangium oxazolinicum TaxID=909287 RepID=A0ABP8AVW7_9ACTN
MAELVRTLVPLIVVMGLVAALAVLLSGGGAVGALAVLLDFLLAAGLLRLSQAQTWAAIATAALTVLVRKLAVAGFSAHTARRRPPGRRPGAPTPSGWDQDRTG